MLGYDFSTLFLDCDSYFASVEQQSRPELRGRPVGVIPVASEHTCCIAASYEAKAFGVRTGTPVREARAMCPSMRFVLSRPGLYLDTHHRMLDAVRECVELRQVHSVDEVSCGVPSSMRSRVGAEEVGREIKAVLRERLGEFIRCSVGVGPNTLLAKMAAEMHKPDGLVALGPQDIPGALLHLDIESVPGIGRRMGARLRAAGVDTMEALYALSEDEAAALWGGVVGRRVRMWLHGRDPPVPRAAIRSVGRQHVLAPEFRSDDAARSVMLGMLLKVVMRSTHLGAAPGRLTISVAFERAEPGRWSADAALPGGCGDFPAMLRTALSLWAARPPGRLKWIGVDLSDLIPSGSATASLFPEERRGEGVTRALYAVNARHGRTALMPASVLSAKDQARGGIAFSVVPDRSFFDIPDAS